MLAAMRKNVKVWSKFVLWPVIIAFVLTVFLVWGQGSSGPSRDNTVAVVNGTSITTGEYQMAYDAVRRMYENIYRQFPGNSPDENQLRQAALQNVIDEALLLQQADVLGLQMSDEDLRARIESEPAFQRNGKFSPQIYQTILNSQRIPPATFEMQMRRDIIAGYVRDLVQQTAKVAAAEIDQELKDRNDKATLDAVLIDAAKLTDDVAITDDEIKAYYDGHREDFRRPEQYRLKFIEISPQTLAAEIQITGDEVEKYYDATQDEYVAPEEVKARHILITADQSATPELQAAAEAKIRDLKQQLDAGADFAELARQHSQDQSNAPQGGDLGFFQRGRMVPEFEQVAFALEPGQVSDPVRTQFGFHLIKVEEKKTEHTKSLEEARPEIEQKLREDKAEQQAQAAIDALYRTFLRTASIEKAVEGTAYPVRETAYFDFDQSPVELGRAPEILEFIKNVRSEMYSEIIRTDRGYYLLGFKDARESEIPPVEEVTERIGATLRTERLADVAMERGKQLVAQIGQPAEDGTGTVTLETAAASHGFEVVEVGPISRSAGFLPRLGSSPEMVRAAFTGKEGDIIGPFKVDQRVALARIKSHTQGTPEELATQQADVRKSLQSQKQQQVLREWLETRRDNANIDISVRYVDIAKELGIKYNALS